MNIHQKENFFFNDTITILSLFTYAVCDEKGKKILKKKTCVHVIKTCRIYFFEIGKFITNT